MRKVPLFLRRSEFFAYLCNYSATGIV